MNRFLFVNVCVLVTLFVAIPAKTSIAEYSSPAQFKLGLTLQYTDDGDELGKLLKKNPGLIDLRDSLDRTLLHWAIDNAALNCTEVLVKHGVDVNHLDRTGKTALYGAPMMEDFPGLKRFRCAEVLLKGGAKVDLISKGFTPLLHAADFGDFRCVKLFLEYGANVQGVENPGRKTPLHFACTPWVSAKDLQARGNPGNEKVIRLLLQYGADPNAMDLHEFTPAAKAAYNKRQDVLDALERIKQNPDPPLQPKPQTEMVSEQ